MAALGANDVKELLTMICRGDEAVTSGKDSGVLICDADLIAARLLSRILADAGFDVTTCASATDCEAILARETFALACVAILLPGTDGLALTRSLRRQHPDLRIVVISALRADDRAMEAGADAFVPKPISRERVLATVRALTVEVA